MNESACVVGLLRLYMFLCLSACVRIRVCKRMSALIPDPGA